VICWIYSTMWSGEAQGLSKRRTMPSLSS
jgi:hypothetical protein